MRSNVKVYQRKIVERRRKRALYYSLAWIAAAALALAGLSWLSRIEATELSKVRIEGNQRISEAEVSAVVAEETAGNWLGILSKRNALLAPEDAVAARIAAMPAALAVEVDAEGLHGLAIHIEERQEEARLCLGPLGDLSSCYSADADGFVFDEAATSSETVAYRDGREGDPIGGQILEPSHFKNLQFFARELASLGLAPRDVELREAAYMTVALEGGGRLIVNRADDLSKTLGNLASLLENRQQIPSVADFAASLDYMRLDSGNKIFYKLKD